MNPIDQTSARIVSAIAGFALAMTLVQVARARQRQRGNYLTAHNRVVRVQSRRYASAGGQLAWWPPSCPRPVTPLRV